VCVWFFWMVGELCFYEGYWVVGGVRLECWGEG
jgi:hypothetical protein